MNRVLPVIYGPTSSGKTDYALSLSLSTNIISADSRQIYRYMDIGTGKDIGNATYKDLKTPKIIDKKIHWGYYHQFDSENPVKLWLLDLVYPSDGFSSVDWSLLTAYLLNKYEDCMIVGGSGYYIKTLIDGIQNYNLNSNFDLRKELEKLELGKLQKMLGEIWPDRLEGMNDSDRKNPRRLIRAIEIAQNKKSDKPMKFLDSIKVKGVYLMPDFEYLKTKIRARAKDRLKEGLLDEIANLLKKGYKWDDPGMNTMGYREFRQYFSSERSKEECFKEWVSDEIKYAKRQMLWFRDDERFTKVSTAQKNKKFIEKKIASLLTNKY